MDSSRLVPFLYVYLFEQPTLHWTYPFIVMKKGVPDSFIRPHESTMYSPAAGIFSLVPYLWVMVVGPIFFWARQKAERKGPFIETSAIATTLARLCAFYIGLMILTMILTGIIAGGTAESIRALVCSTLFQVPFWLVLPLMFIVSVYRRMCIESGEVSWPRGETMMLFASAAMILAPICLFQLTSARYLVDFSTLLILCGFILWMRFEKLFRGTAGYDLFVAVYTVLSTMTLLIGGVIFLYSFH